MLFVIIHFNIKFNIYRSKIVARRLGSVKTLNIEICFSCFADSFAITFPTSVKTLTFWQRAHKCLFPLDKNILIYFFSKFLSMQKSFKLIKTNRRI